MSLRPFEVIVEGLYVPKRLDAYLAAMADQPFSRSQIKKAIESGQVTVNGKPAKPKTLVTDGDRIAGRVESSGPAGLEPEQIPLKILFEDDHLLVVDKPAGMVVHPGAGNLRGTLVHALLGRGSALSEVGGSDRPGIVHRLDKETSGLLVVAKTNEAHRRLQDQFADKRLKKTYIALVKGVVRFDRSTILEPIDRHPKVRAKMTVSQHEGAKEAETHYRVLKRFRAATLLELDLVTGRTHQIRVHMAHAGYPVVGDALYGHRDGAVRHALHAAKIEFEHPKNASIMKFESPLPQDFKDMVKLEESK